MVGIIRVYAPGVTHPLPYKFFTVAVLRGGLCEIHGMFDSHITVHDLKAMDKELRRFGVKKAAWVHNGEIHEYNLRCEK